MANDNLVKLLYYNDKDPLSQENLTDEQKKTLIYGKLIKPIPRIGPKETANSIIKDIGNSSTSSQANKLRKKLNEEISSINTDSSDIKITHPIKIDQIRPGLTVFVSNLNTEGTVVSNISKDNTVQVQIGAMKMKIDIKYLQEILNTPSKNEIKKYNHTNSSSFKSKYVSPEINLLGLTVDEAIPIIDKYLDDCYIAKLSPVRIVHGKGTGALRKGIHNYLKSNKLVSNFRLGTFGEGEMGVTIVDLKL